MKSRFIFAAALAVLSANIGLAGDALPVFRLSMKGGRFEPPVLTVPSGRKFQLVLSNEDDRPFEFESFKLHREQVVVAHSEASLFLGPLKPGSYAFFDDFNAGVKGGLEAVEKP